MEELEKQAIDLISGIGKRIRDIRNKRGMNLKDLAQKTGFTKSYLSQIETMKREPPISTLSKIAYVLSVDVTFLISGERRTEKSPGITVVRKGEGRANYGPFGERGFLYESLSYKKSDRLMDAYIITIGNDFPPKAFSHEGQEIVYVLEGTQEFLYDGETYFFHEGDSFFFDSNKPHYSRTVGEGPGKILMVFSVMKANAPGEMLSLKKIEREN
ncbi:MAG: XRE family transcriptional regulator [Thermodesulfobacteriota bacterium]